MKKIFTIFLINILKVVLFFAVAIEKVFEILLIAFEILFFIGMVLDLRIKGDIRGSSLSEIIKELMYYHANSCYEPEELKPCA